MVKNNIHEEDHIIEHMLELLQKKMAQMCNKQSASPDTTNKKEGGQH
jgi:hypothetical protein